MAPPADAGARRGAGLNYRHAYHAGNFADVVKHAVLAQALARMQAAGGPLNVIDTHGGAGLYDLAGPEAARSGEAAAGVLRLMEGAAPKVFAPYLERVAPLLARGLYPGSPVLIAKGLRRGDALVACELNPKDYAPLAAALRPWPAARAAQGDGYGEALKAAGREGRLLVHIDPPFESSADYAAAAEAAAGVLKARPDAGVIIWAPLKDLDTFDRFLTRLEALDLPPALVAELRIRPLSDPMRMNGCALVLLGPPAGMRDEVEQIFSVCAQRLGETGAEARVSELS